MPTTSLDQNAACPACQPDTSPLRGTPWSIRLAGACSARPALEFYEACSLLDVVSSTPVAPQLVRGARAASQAGRQRVLAWGRLPASPAGIAVAFTSGIIWRRALQAEVIEITSWCWLAIADGRFDRVVVSAGENRVQHRLAGGR
jgi:hypothetical protein